MNILNKKAIALFALVTAAVVTPFAQASWYNSWTDFKGAVSAGKDYAFKNGKAFRKFVTNPEKIKAYWQENHTNKAKLVGGVALVVAAPVALYYAAKKVRAKKVDTGIPAK